MTPLIQTLQTAKQNLEFHSEFFATLPVLREKVSGVMGLLPELDQQNLYRERAEIQIKKTRLQEALRGYEAVRDDFGFLEFEYRLLFSDAEIWNILEDEIFLETPAGVELGRIFLDYFDAVAKTGIAGTEWKIRGKLMREFRLDNLAFEKNSVIIRAKGIHLDDLWSMDETALLKHIKIAGESGALNIDFWWAALIYLFPKRVISEIVRTAGKSGIRGISFRGNCLTDKHASQKFDKNGIMELVRLAGNSGIRNLSLRGTSLSELLDVGDFLELVRAAGESGILGLDLWLNQLSEKFQVPDYVELVRTAGNSGILNLGLHGDNYSKVLDSVGCIELVRAAGYSGIRWLNIGNNNLSEVSNLIGILEIVRTAGESGIRSLDLSENSMALDFHAAGVREIVRTAGESWIRNLIFRDEGLRLKFDDSGFKELDAIAKKHGMILHIG